MITIRFPNDAEERRGLGYLAGRFSFKSYATGETHVVEAALPYLAREGSKFSVEGTAPYDRLIPTLRNPPAPAV